MALDRAKVLQAQRLEKAREEAEKEQFLVVGKWPRKPIMTKKQAEYEFGEDMGPMLAKMINSGKRRPSRRPELEKLILEWAKANDEPMSVYQLPPNAKPATWLKAVKWCQEAEKKGEMAMIVIGT